MWVEVAVPVPLPTPLVYSVPAALRPRVVPGVRVRVPLGKRRATGVVWNHREAPPEGVSVRPIQELVDLEPVLTPELLDLARFASEYYLASPGEVIEAMLPSKLEPWGDRSLALSAGGAFGALRDELDEQLRNAFLESPKLRLRDLLTRFPDAGRELTERIDRWVEAGRLVDLGAERAGPRYAPAYQLAPGDPEELETRCGRSPVGRDVVRYLVEAGRPATAAELRAETGASDAILRRLAGLGVVLAFRQIERLDLGRHLMPSRGEADRAAIRPTDEQRAAIGAIVKSLEGGSFRTHLLHGITGSGKTEVYLSAAERTLELGRSALLLVPEIALVPALARAAADRFGDRLAVLHSGLATGERSQEWERIRRGEATVVVGPRSALFAPLAGLGLIVVDEEQDSAYKQESSPRYHGRDLALVRCRAAGAVAVLASATPSLEARHAVESGRIGALRLRHRVGAGRPPEGVLVDLRKEPRISRPGAPEFSERLLVELETALRGGGQAIVLRNRRGFAPILLCRACGEEFRCDDCGLPRTYHRRDRRLVCHWCGSARPAPDTCPACQGEGTLEPIGAGTERVGDQLAELFPDVPIGILDRDTTRRIGGAAAILERFRRRETRILVGTQMLSKGHHFPDVSLTAVVNADALLGFPDFRAVERTYVLLTQLAGRAGRGERPGRVVLQTHHPEHYAILAALEHDDDAFAEQEMRFRRIFDYPPFSRMVLLLSRDRDREAASGRLREIARALGRRAEADGLRLSGPAPAPLERLKGEWRFQLLVRAREGRRLRAAVKEALGDKPPAGVQVDVDPYQLL